MLKLSKITSRLSFLLFFIPLLTAFKCVKGSTEYVYETLDMRLSNTNTSGEHPMVVGDSVLKNFYAIQVQLTFSPPDGTEKEFETHRNEDSVTDFHITSTEEFNGIAPGTSLNHLFSFRKTAGQFVGITSESYTDIFSISAENTIDNYLFLTQPPSAAGDYTFHLSATFSDGRILEKSISVNLHE